jgi:hypothetical protein
MRSLRRTRPRQRRDRGELVECFRVARLDRNFAEGNARCNVDRALYPDISLLLMDLAFLQQFA